MRYNEDLDISESYTDKPFYLPKFEGDPKEEEYYLLTKSFLTQIGETCSDKRVYSITYIDKEDNTHKVVIGDNYKNSFIAAIFESDYLKGVFYIVTPGRGIPN